MPCHLHRLFHVNFNLFQALITFLLSSLILLVLGPFPSRCPILLPASWRTFLKIPVAGFLTIKCEGSSGFAGVTSCIDQQLEHLMVLPNIRVSCLPLVLQLDYLFQLSASRRTTNLPAPQKPNAVESAGMHFLPGPV